MSERGFTEYFNSIDKIKIKDCLNFLRSNLPKKPTKNNYQLTNDQLQLLKIFTLRDNLQGRLQKVADLIRIHLEINEPIKILTLDNIEAGKFEIIDNLNCIFINANPVTQTIEQKIAILIHEMSHYHLISKHKIIKDRKEENELLTEINAIYCGFGFFLLRGYKENNTHFGDHKTKSKVGYINQWTIKETIIQTAYLRKQNPHWILKNINILDKPYFYFKLRELRLEYKKNANKV